MHSCLQIEIILWVLQLSRESSSHSGAQAQASPSVPKPVWLILTSYLWHLFLYLTAIIGGHATLAPGPPQQHSLSPSLSPLFPVPTTQLTVLAHLRAIKLAFHLPRKGPASPPYCFSGYHCLLIPPPKCYVLKVASPDTHQVA